MMMTTALAETVAMIAKAAVSESDEWWIIGSAAVVLHGGAVPKIKDVDLMMSAEDAEAFLSRVGGRHRKAGSSERFRSQVFGLWDKPPIPVEVFGGLTVAVDGEWREVSLSTRQRVTVAGAHVYLPSAKELIRLLHLFGRSKDLERASLLRA